MNPVATSHASGCTADLHASRTATQCAQRLQPTRRFGCNALRSCSRHLHRTRKPALETCLVAAVEAPTAADSSDSVDQMNPHDLYKRFEKLLSQHKYKYKQGDRVRGIIFAVDQRGASVDIGAKSPAICPAEECSLAGVQRATQVLKAMEERDFIVVRDEWKGGDIRLSLRKAEEAICWKRVHQMQEEDITVTGKVVQVNKGGVMVEVEHLRGFVPLSQLPNTNFDNIDDLVGTDLPVKFLEIEQERERLVFSARKASNDMKAFNIGELAEGVIQSITPYGAFVDLGNGMSGLLHISQISHDRITNVGAILSEGDKLKVMVLSQDRDRGRMSLSTKKLEPSPGDMLKDPQKVYDQADEMATAFRERLAEAEAMARQEQVQY